MAAKRCAWRQEGLQLLGAVVGDVRPYGTPAVLALRPLKVSRRLGPGGARAVSVVPIEDGKGRQPERARTMEPRAFPTLSSQSGGLS